MAAEVDVRAISSFASVPESTITSLLNQPTTDLVQSLLQGIASKIQEHEQLRSQKVRVETELETHVRKNESKVKAARASVDKALAETSKLRVELQTSENARSRLESELDQLKSATTNDVSEAASLKSRISSLEAANRDTLAILDSKTTAYDKLAQDLSTQHQKTVEFRKQISALEQTVQTASSAASSAKFREQSLEQELDLLRKSNEWLDTELKTKAADHLKFRKDKNARISELTSSNEQYISEAEALKRSEAALRSRLEEQVQKIEEFLQETQQIKEEKISDAEAFKVELDSVTRLAELQKASADTAKQRAHELSTTLEEIKEEAAEEIGKLRAENETEHNDREASEQRVAELETRVSQLQAELDQARTQPETPQRGMNGNGTSTPIRPGTPSGIFSPGSAMRLKPGLSNTQMFSEYKRLERELAIEKRSTEQLQGHLDAMVQDLEASKPEFEQLKDDNAKMQTEIVEMASLVDAANRDRDIAVKEARSYQGQVEAQLQEISILSQQVRDGNTSTKMLLMEQHLREQGQDYNPEELREIAGADDLSTLSDTGRIISANLVGFRTIVECQERNATMLRMLRELGELMEKRDAEENARPRKQLQEELDAAQARIASYEDEVRSMATQTNSYIKERDMFRKMLTRRGQLPQIESHDFSRSMPMHAGTPPRGFDESVQGSMTGESDYAKLLKDLQTHFDSYRKEASTDHSALKKQVDDLSARNSQLQNEIGRTMSQLSAANQRSEMLQSNFNMLKTESAELQKRSYAAMENATRQEVATQHAAEELIEAKGMLDSLRRESANLKAEKDLWKNVEKRLIEDNESLRNERARLDQLNGSLQNILNEREQSDSETRRRLQAQNDSLESELQIAKRRLNDELNESKNASQRREYEHEQSQKRIDDLVASLGSVREELAAAKTARDHLQARVDEMTVELRSAEERLEVLTRPAPEPVDDETAHENILSREQELEVQVSELRRDLELQVAEVARANEEIEVYKSISQSSEERLREATETNDQYREETDRRLDEREKRIQDLEQRIEDISTELNTTNNELSQLRNDQNEGGRRIEEQKAIFEAEIARLKEQEERNAEQAAFNLEATKAQAQIATEAQQNYEAELVKHAEAAKSLGAIRAESNQLRLEIMTFKSQAESAQANLLQNQESWQELQSRYERELTDLRTRREETVHQNTLLHGQLEELTKQITSLRQDRAAVSTSEAIDTSAPGLENLQEVIAYLRREKEIVDVQYHMSTQQAKRLQQQLDHVQSQLDESRLKLDQQRRTEADSERNALSHNKLMDTLNELNLHRESNATLRAESRQTTQALAEKTQQVDELNARIVPLQARVVELESLSEFREGEIKLLQEDRDHWQQRTQNILSKYDRVDPAELDSLREQISALETAKDEAVAARDSLQTQLDGFPEQLETARKDLRTRLGEQFKSRSAAQKEQIREKQSEVDAAKAEVVNLQTELELVRKQLETAQSQANATANANAQSPSVVNGPPDARQPASSNTTSAEDSSEKIKVLENRIVELESVLSTKDQELSDLRSQQDQKFKARETELKGMLNKRLAELKTESATAKTTALNELRQSLLAEHQHELETLRSQSIPTATQLQKPDEGPETPVQPSEPPVSTSGGDLPVITEEQAKMLVQKNETIRRILISNIKKKEEAIRKEYEASQAAIGDTLSSEKVAELERKFAEQDKVMRDKDNEFAIQNATLIKEYEEKFASDKQALLDEQSEKLNADILKFSKEAEKKIADQVALAEKRTAVKLNMATNRERAAAAKLEVVKVAAEETPQKPVIEVWEIAKLAKPPPVKPAEAAATVPTAVPPPNPVTAQVNGTPAPVNANAVSATDNSNNGAALLNRLQTGIPQSRIPSRGGRGGGPAVSGQNPQAHLQPAASRGSAIPRGNPRGGGYRGGRAGAQNVQTNVAAAPPVASSPKANLNPNAQQFQPGKRQRDEDVGDAGNMGKRIRGGGAGAGV